MIDAATFNVHTATCDPQCVQCNGFVDAWNNPAPANLAMGANLQMQAIGQYSSGGQFDKTNNSTWSTDNPAVATVSSAVVNGVSPGGFNVISSFFAPDGGVMACQPPAFDANGDPIFCPHTSEFQSTSQGTIRNPSHLKVVSDTFAADTACPSIKLRKITYQEVDANLVATGTNKTKEQFSSKGTNSCGTTISTSESCSTDTGGQFTDVLTVGCSAVGHTPCGFTYTKQQWFWCPADGSAAVLIATPGDLVLTDTSVSIGGNTTGFAAGTIMP